MASLKQTLYFEINNSSSKSSIFTINICTKNIIIATNNVKTMLK